ncbi:translation initiation factor IF-2-like [Hyaena hyaena]|uniref:translation initiation factor IF-2-like n=1 Tax=Hyaena hyaena TaxID=95912 RepID=UPI0019205B4E|nr:translation initiation factor IF-2-like [Hyaena hyaena]
MERRCTEVKLLFPLYLAYTGLQLSRLPPNFPGDRQLCSQHKFAFLNSWNRQNCDRRARTEAALFDFHTASLNIFLEDIYRATLQCLKKIQQGSFSLTVEDRPPERRRGARPPKVSLRPVAPARPRGTAEAKAPTPAPPRLPHAGHWRVRKTRGVVGLNGRNRSWGAGAEEGAAEAGRRCGTLAPGGVLWGARRAAGALAHVTHSELGRGPRACLPRCPCLARRPRRADSPGGGATATRPSPQAVAAAAPWRPPLSRDSPARGRQRPA